MFFGLRNIAFRYSMVVKKKVDDTTASEKVFFSSSYFFLFIKTVICHTLTLYSLPKTKTKSSHLNSLKHHP